MTQANGTRLSSQASRKASRQASGRASGRVSGLVPTPVGTRAAADHLAEHLIEAYRHAAECEDPVALDLIRLALWHVGRTYSPAGTASAPEGR